MTFFFLGQQFRFCSNFFFFFWPLEKKSNQNLGSQSAPAYDQFELKVKYKVNTDSVLVGVLKGLGAPPNIFGIVSKFLPSS
jgi:hypothetical protein